MKTLIELEIHIEKEWRKLGTVEIKTQNGQSGISTPASFEFDEEYLDAFGAKMHANNIYTPSVRYPLSYVKYDEPTWPSFLLDIIPTGAARENWLERLGLKNGPDVDYQLLVHGAINPPGNLRVKSENKLFEQLSNHPGFDYEDVVARGTDFVDYAEKMGAIVSGTSGAQGEAPKFLLVEDSRQRWHGDGAIRNDQIRKNWLVKFSRGKKEEDYFILKAEASYYEIARELGARVLGPLKWDRDTLFVPRFDREMDGYGNTLRLGLESLISAMGVSQLGAIKRMEDYIKVIKKYSTNANADILEFAFRDFLNIVMGNTDNHGRNTALVKKLDGTIALSPLFDFAPMVLDDAGIPRATKWENETLQVPDFFKMNEFLVAIGLGQKAVDDFLRGSHEKLLKLPLLLQKYKLDDKFGRHATKKYQPFMDGLKQFLAE